MGVRLGQRERVNPLGMIAPIAAAVRARRSEKPRLIGSDLLNEYTGAFDFFVLTQLVKIAIAPGSS